MLYVTDVMLDKIIAEKNTDRLYKILYNAGNETVKHVRIKRDPNSHRYNCVYCESSFSTYTNFLDHVNVCRLRVTNRRSENAMEFFNNSQVDITLYWKVCKLPREDGGLRECNKCGATFLGSLHNHNQICNLVRVCFKCLKSYWSPDDYKTHLNDDEHIRMEKEPFVLRNLKERFYRHDLKVKSVVTLTF